MKHFEEIKVLGDGAFGVVTKCRNLDNDQFVAIKKMKAKYNSFEECLQEKEVKSLRKIKHENVEKLLQVFRENDHLYLVFELLDESLLKTMSKRTQPFSNEEVRYIMGQIFPGLNIIHKQGFFHRDMKPDNLLWSQDGVLKIADFGLAREIRSRPPYTEYISTRWYRAPEIILRHPFYNSPVDIWAAGAIMAELYMLKPIFPGSSETDQMYKICSVLGNPTMETWPDGVKLAAKTGFKMGNGYHTSLQQLMPNASPEAIDLMTQLLQFDPSKRPSASQALTHPFFKGPSINPRQNNNAQSNKITSSETEKRIPDNKFNSVNYILSTPTAPVMANPKLNTGGFKANKDTPEIQKHTGGYLKSNILKGLGPRQTPSSLAAQGNSFGGNTILNSLNDDLFDDIF